MVLQQQVKKRSKDFTDEDLLNTYTTELSEVTTRLQQQTDIQIALIKAQTDLMKSCMEFDYEIDDKLTAAITGALGGQDV